MTEWISVKDMLPEPWQYVLVAKRVGGRFQLVIAVLTDRGNWAMGFGTISACVTHWMPLPEPPKEE